MMTMILTAEQQEWMAARVAEGEFDSVEAGVRQLLDERIAEREFDAGDDWVEPLIDEGVAAFSKGDFMTFDEHRARNVSRLAALETK